jgi:plastocyanin
MRLWILTPLLVIPAMFAAPGCGGDETATTSTTSSSTTGGGANVHDCSQADATDMTAAAAATITFAGVAYTPKCVRVKAGTDVTFTGDFASHPLVGGEFVDTIKTPDPSSPITSTMTGMTATFTMATAGAYPYYCNVHASVGMVGVIFVE